MNAASLGRSLINRTWITTCLAKHRRFQSSLGRVEEVQCRHLLELLHRNADTAFGRKHGFSRIRTVREYQQQVPMTGYEGFSNAIESIARGDANVLTHDSVRLFHPTSGSQSATKLIPWTASLAREFQCGIAPWLVSLYRRKPAIMRGTTYWSLSPPLTPIKIHGGIRVGFDDDSEYLGVLGRKLFSKVSTVPPEVASCATMDQFRLRTLASLLGDEALSLISVWSPTFLTALLDDLMRRPDEILAAVADGGGARAKERAKRLASILKSEGSAGFERIWPDLQVISCWTHGASETYARNLRRYFPTVEIQGKGLVATEAFISLPFHPALDPVLAVPSHFFEFYDLATAEVFLAHELKEGNIYGVVVTTGGGLYRYRLGDLIRVTGFSQEAPCFRFIGRDGVSCDLFGEKLHGTVVEATVRDTLKRLDLIARFFLLAPVVNTEGSTSYTLFLDVDHLPSVDVLRGMLEGGLCENFHYAHCRQLGQLAPLRIFRINRNAQSPEDVFLTEMQKRGIKHGATKMVCIDSHSGWERSFNGEFA